MVGDVIHSLNTVFFGPGIYEPVTQMSPLSGSVLSRLSCHHRTCFSRAMMVFWVVAWGTG